MVRLKLAVPAPVTAAVTVYGPAAVLLAVNTGADATPDALVTAVAVLFEVLANVPLAPVDGAVKVTVTPAIGLVAASITLACNAVAKAVLTAVLCGVPAKADILAGV